MHAQMLNLPTQWKNPEGEKERGKIKTLV